MAGQEEIRIPTAPESARNTSENQVKANPDWLKDNKTPEIKKEFKKCCEGGDCNACPLGKENKVDAKKIVASVNLDNKLF
jgi:hypothetical protein